MTNDPNVVTRLKRRIDDARALGFKVRMEPLDGEQATWCEIAGVPNLFIDLSQTAAEQLQQLDETLKAYCRRGRDDRADDSMEAVSGSALAVASDPIDRAA